MAILGCLISAAVAIPLLNAGPGEEVASAPVTLGQPYAVTYNQDGDQRYEAWLEVDIEYTQGYQLNGNALLSENGAAFGQYTVDDDGEGSPVTERDSSTRSPWSSSSANGDGSSDGNVLLFPIPAKTDGATVTVSGTITAPPGTTGTLRLLITERD